jgi:hypothetical protein
MAQNTNIGARSLTGRRHYGLRWLPWLALALLALLALVIFLIVTNVADDDDRAGVDVGDDEQAAPAASRSPPAAEVRQQPGAAGTLTTGGTPLSGASLAGFSGQAVDGRGVVVDAVVADEGFWARVPQGRVFVFLTPQARTKAGESPFQVRAEQRVDLSGTVRRLPADLTPFGVDDNEGAAELRAQGYYVEATSIRLSR